MSNARAISGEYSDLKTVKTRSVVQIIVECPIENGEEIVRMFGFPQPGKPIRVAVARINAVKEVVPRPNKSNSDLPNKTGASDRQPRAWSELPLAQQAGIRCGEEAFRKFLVVADAEDGSGIDPNNSFIRTADDAANYVRWICGVKSRADLDKTPAARAKWLDLETRYQVWLRDPVGEFPEGGNP